MTGRQERGKSAMRMVFAWGAVGAACGIYGAVWLGYYNRILREPFLYRGRWLFIAMYAVLYTLFMKLYGGFRVGYLKTGSLICSQILSSLFANVFTYAQLAVLDKKFLNPVYLIAGTAAQILASVLWITLFQSLSGRLFPPRRLLFLTGDHEDEDLMAKVRSREDKYEIGQILDYRVPAETIQAEMIRWDAVLIGDLPSHERNLILKYCFTHKIRTYSTPKISDILIRTSEELDIFDTPLYLSRNTELTAGQRCRKRLMDVIGSVVLGACSLPLVAAIGAAIWLSDRGPVFYSQERLTQDGRVFQIYKFRTMVQGAEADGTARLAEEEDSRILPVGRFLRQTRLDELPQLWNVFRGEMSLVGPRPERPELAAAITRELPEFTFRLKVKAGLTGYAQIHGRYNTSACDKLRMDLTYIRNYSFLTDLKLISMTPKILFMRESARGVSGEGQNGKYGESAEEAK